MKKLVCLLLVLTMLSAFTACANDSENNSNDQNNETTIKGETTTVVEENPFEEFFEITWLTQLNKDWQDGRWDEKELEEIFNVDLQVWPMDSYNDKEAMAALVAAGDMADFNFMPIAPRSPSDMYKEELTRSIPLDMFKDYLPGYYKLLEMMPIGLKYNLVEGTTDEYLGITHVGFASAQYFYDATVINLDWLEAIGYDVDDSALKPVKMITEGYDKFNDNIFFGELNFSFDDFNDILRAFTEDDPDGNGEDDTYGMMYLPESAWTNMTQEGLFGFVHDVNYLYEDTNTGDVVPKYAYTPYRDYLAWVSETLNKGYIRKLPGETGWVAEYQQLSATNKMGIFQGHRDGYLQLTSDVYRNYPPQNILLGVDEDARFFIGPAFRGPEGKLVDATYSIDTFGVGARRVEMIGRQVSDAKLERILRMLQYIIYEEEATFNRYHYGIENIHWKWAGEPYKSAKVITPQADLDPEYRGNTRVFTCWLMQWPTAQLEIDAALNDGFWSSPAYMYANGLYEKYACQPAKYISEVYMGTELFEKYTEMNNELSSQVNAVVNDFKNRALNGEIANFNSEWTQYIEQLYAAGLEQLIDEVYTNPDYEEFNPGDKFKVTAPLY